MKNNLQETADSLNRLSNNTPVLSQEMDSLDLFTILQGFATDLLSAYHDALTTSISTYDKEQRIDKICKSFGAVQSVSNSKFYIQ